LRALRERKYDVLACSRSTGDIAQPPLTKEKVTHVFHLAARTFVPDSWESPPDFYRTNVLGTVTVLEYCRRQGAALTLLSSYVYGRPRRLPIDEDQPVEAFNPYGHSKILAEEAARYYAVQFGVRAAIVRPFNIYGPGQNDRFLVPSLVRQAVDPCSGDITVTDLRPRRDFMHVRDLARLLLLAAERQAVGTYNAGSGKSVSIAEIVGLINRALPHPKQLVCTNRVREDEVLDTVADCSKAENELGWKPQIPFETGIAEMVAGALAAQSTPADSCVEKTPPTRT
jgi:nucleoside-diphosphate-sugar epimerase